MRGRGRGVVVSSSFSVGGFEWLGGLVREKELNSR